MNTMLHPDPRITEYLARFDAAAGNLPADRRAELMSEIREHIDAALGAAGSSDEATVRNVLERLGPPEEIVAADGEAPGGRAAEQHDSAGVLEIAGLIALIVPVIGWVAGAIVVSLSRAWSAEEKRLGLMLPWIGAVLSFVIALSAGASTSTAAPDAGGGLGPIEVFSLLTFFCAGLVSAGYLAWRLRRHSTA